MSTESVVKVKKANPFKDYFAFFVILISMIIGFLVYFFIMGDPSHFENNDPSGHPKQGDYLGIMYKGGILVPIALGLILVNIIISIERFIILWKARGRMPLETFVYQVQQLLEEDRIDEAIELCDQQRGTVGNVVKEALLVYKKMIHEKRLTKEQKVAAIQKAIEEATALELPVLEKHLTIIATIVSIATLVGLIGTVLGMIRAFAALATAGAPDAVALATGISEALVNTALGITNSTIATIMYNYFTSQIDDMLYRIDEVGYSIVQTFIEKYD